ncbi:MAG: SDR family oxidoreductase [Bacteroidetes bacterium]|nr:MAG: SDR family oxidoreductase [Bacteroidota bacterium]
MSKNILVIGASSGIGLSLAQQLVAENHHVWVASRRKPEVSASYLPLDITKPIENALDSLPEALHGVAYCPGTINLKPFHRLTEEEFLQDFQVNVMGAVRVLQAVFPRLRKEGGSVVLFSTVASALGMNFHSSIAIAKSAIEGLTKSLAAEWATYQIRVNAIAPSLTDTPLASKILTNDEKRETSGKRHPLGRVGKAEEVAELAHFLLSDKTAWITGQIIGIDGGMGSLKP